LAQRFDAEAGQAKWLALSFWLLNYPISPWRVQRIIDRNLNPVGNRTASPRIIAQKELVQ
jgi:hypothetical protein